MFHASLSKWAHTFFRFFTEIYDRKSDLSLIQFKYKVMFLSSQPENMTNSSKLLKVRIKNTKSFPHEIMAFTKDQFSFEMFCET